ncbi:MAG: polysaccharide biosynthesis protein [bacterium]|nr:polysaccharide biosynthesis protein [bacterium]
MKNEFKNKTILVTGGTGTVGMELVKQIFSFKPKQVRVLSRDETKQSDLREFLNRPGNLRLLIGDVRDRDRLDTAFKEVDVVLHAAALKHVSHCEYNPFEAVKTNIIGSQNVIDMAVKHKVKKVIGISTDKAVNPVNVMGASKLMMEKLFTNANYSFGKINTKFSCVRFGNIAWARGSVLPLWRQQAETKKTIGITDKAMTRFFISNEQAIKLVLRAVELTQGGEIFILKMPSIKIEDLARIFIKKYFPGKKINMKIINNLAGEKKYEDLLDKQDKYKQIFENKEMFVIVPDIFIINGKRPPRKYPGFNKAGDIINYSSPDCVNVDKIRKII